MRCLDGQEALRAIHAAGAPAISSDVLDRMLLHAEECPTCSTELREAAAHAILAQSPPVRRDPARAARLRARVLERATGGSPSVPSVRAVRPWPRSRRTRASVGWLASATLFVALLTHHGFHEPLSSGWLVAAVFAALALGLGIYARSQQRRAAELENRLSTQEPAHPGDRPGSPGR